MFFLAVMLNSFFLIEIDFAFDVLFLMLVQCFIFDLVFVFVVGHVVDDVVAFNVDSILLSIRF